MRCVRGWVHAAPRLRWFLLIALSLLSSAVDRPPWRARKRDDVHHNRHAAESVSPNDWGKEPDSPKFVDRDRLAAGIRELCGWMPPLRPLQYAQWVTRYGTEFDVDPFLLGALIYRQSRCRPRKEQLSGLGLTLLAPRMYRGGFKGRRYHYYVGEPGRLEPRTRSFSRFPFIASRLLQAEPNLYFTAGLLAVWREQHETVDREFPQVPHRHYVSHWVWGDRVPSARAEDRILTDRRRLLEYYGAIQPAAPRRVLGFLLSSPLDGAPRVVSSGLGFERDGGARSHRGVDVESEFGESVRAIAQGRVVFSGVDLPGSRRHESLDPAQTNEYDRRLLGRGGRYVCLLHPHPTGEAPLRSCYMHLETVEVSAGDDVEPRQRIGTVGRTGMKRSAPHLHLELYRDGKILDGREVLAGHLIGEPTEFEE